MSNDDSDQSEENIVVSSNDLPEGHPFKNLTPEQIHAEIQRSHNETVAIQLDAYSQPENIDLIAKFYRQLFMALEKEGFSEDQALEIVKSTGLPRRL